MRFATAPVVICTAALLALPMPARGDDEPKAEDLIAQTLTAYANAWNTGDARALSDLYTVHADYTGFGSVMTRGRAEIEARYQQLFAAAYAGSQAAINMSSLRFVKPDVAIVDGTLELSGIKGPNRSMLDPAGALFIAIMTKDEGRWLFTTFWSKRVQLVPPSQ